jgi:septal ring factor EnvC (AmiA/AmiB activator)
MRTTLLLILCLLVFGPSASAKKKKDAILDQKNELETIKKDVSESQKRLDSLKSVEEKIQKQIADYDQKMSSDTKIISRLNSELKQLKKNVTQAEEQLAAHQQSFDQTQRRYLGNIRQFYYAVAEPHALAIDAPNTELDMQRQVTYLTSLANFESDNVALAGQFLANSVAELDTLSGQTRLVTEQKKKKEVSYSLGTSQKEMREREARRIARLKQDEADRMLTLQQAAKEMENIIARLEEEQSLRDQIASGLEGTSVFISLKGQLLMPFRGTITTRFGNAVHPVTKLRSYSPGIVIKGQASAGVRAVASGTVAYSGNLRGYGNFVIINHDNEYYTTYAGLGSIQVTERQYVPAGMTLGKADAEGEVRFELRKGREPLDPVEWIKFEAL